MRILRGTHKNVKFIRIDALGRQTVFAVKDCDWIFDRDVTHPRYHYKRFAIDIRKEESE